MSLPREQKKAQPPWLDLAVFTAVLGFLAYSLRVFFGGHAPPPPAELPKSEPSAQAAAKPERAPASQVPQSSSAGSTEVIRLPCLREGVHDLSSTARLVQIHSPLCGDGKSPDGDWHATNESSGEEILVFVNRRDKTLSTSYFNLKEGRNELVFVEDLGKGRVRREKLLVNRKAD
jgi:hypothetical protein